MPKRRIVLRSEQLYAVAKVGEQFALGGERVLHIPWKNLRKCHLYALSEQDLKAMLEDAVQQGYMILDGMSTERKGLRGYKVAIGAWGWNGSVECRTVDGWCVETQSEQDPIDETIRLQTLLRSLCNRINAEETPFKSTALRWLGGLYRRLNLEPEGLAEVLPQDISLFCRRAHVGGPILHVQTTLEPFVRLDRKRAYGTAMLGNLPCGAPYEVPLSKNQSLTRWRPHDLQRMAGMAEATIEVFDGPMVSLIPLLKWHFLAHRTTTLYPTGTLRGIWCLHELVYLEQSNRGRVLELHRVIGFDSRPVLAPILHYLRTMEGELKGVKAKRLEHLLYGNCSKTLQYTRFSTGYSRDPLPGDLVRPEILQKLGPDTTIDRFPLSLGVESKLPLYRVMGRMSGKAQKGSVDRPDRSAWITATNRIEMSRILDKLDTLLKPARSGDYVGRIYVDGMDIQAKKDQIPLLEGVEIEYSGPSLSLYRAGACVAQCEDGTMRIEAAGLPLPSGTTPEDLVKILRQGSSLDQGPFAGGRCWDHIEGASDPRLIPHQVSHPFHLDLALIEQLGFLE
jgi:hypothetical protein